MEDKINARVNAIRSTHRGELSYHGHKADVLKSGIQK